MVPHQSSGPNRQICFLVRLFARVRQVRTATFETKQGALAALPQPNAALPADMNAA
jgi:hypothetical protein